MASLRRATDWIEYFDDLPEPAPPPHGLADLHAYVLGTGAMPVLHRFKERDEIDPEAVAERIDTSDLVAVNAAVDELIERRRALVDRVWGSPSQYAQEVVAEVLRRLRGEPRTVEGRVLPSIGAGQLEGTHGVGAHDLAAVVERLLADRRLFLEEMPPPSAIRWSRSGARNWGWYRVESEQIVVNHLLDSHEADPEVLDFLVYHELLHDEQKVTEAYLGPRNHLMHGPAFRRRESQHPAWERANAFLDTFEERFFSSRTR